MAKKEIGRPPTANIPPFGLRLQPELKERIEQEAKAAGRSMNAEIADRLERSFRATTSDAVDAYVRHLQLEMAGMHSELVVFATEARAAAQMLISLCDELDHAPEPKPSFLITARRMAETVLRSSDRYGRDFDLTLEKMKAKAEQITSGALYPHEFSDRSVFQWAMERARELGLVDEKGREIPRS